MLRRFGVKKAVFSIVLDILQRLVAVVLATYLVRYIPASLTNLRGPANIVQYTNLSVRISWRKMFLLL